MSDSARRFVNKGLPWRSEASWPVVAVEAVILIVIGAFMLIDTDRAGDVVLQIIGLAFLIASALLGAGSFRQEAGRLGAYDAFRAGIGVTAGLIATASWWSDYIQNNAVRLILGWGLVAYSILHFAGLLAVRGRSGLRPSVLAIVALSLVLGIVLLSSNDTVSESRLNLLGVIFVVFGVILAALAYLFYSRDRAEVSRTSIR